MTRAPIPHDMFSFGLWTVGWTGTDPFGVASRPPMEPWTYAEKLAELGVLGVTLHDNDLFPFDADEGTREGLCRRFKDTTDAAGLVIEMGTTNSFTHPFFKDLGFLNLLHRWLEEGPVGSKVVAHA